MPSSPKVQVFVFISVCNCVKIFCWVAESQLITFTVVSLVQPENILSISLTLEVLKLDKSRLVNLKQLKNILPILITLEVSNDDKSREVNDLQVKNILPIFVTLEVPNDDKSRLFKRVQ